METDFKNDNVLPSTLTTEPTTEWFWKKLAEKDEIISDLNAELHARNLEIQHLKDSSLNQI